MNEEEKVVYVQVHIDPESDKPSYFSVNRIPFTEYRLHPGQTIPMDKLYSSYDKLMRGLLTDFRISSVDVPPQEYFEPTPDELEYGEDPILRVVPAEPQEMTWEKDARVAVQHALESAHWDYENQTVTIYDRDNPRMNRVVESFEELQTELEAIADVGSQNSMPWDGGPVFSIDAEDIVLTQLEEYEENIRRLGWNQEE